MKRFSVTRVMLFEYLLQQKKVSGYDFMKYCRRMGISISSGTVYPCLRELKEQGMVEEKEEGRKKVYVPTSRALEFAEKSGPRRKLDRGFKELFFKFLHHLERMDWKKRNMVSLLLEDIRGMERYLEEILERKGRKNE